MATTDFDGVNLMLLREDTLVTLVLGDKSYMGTLKMRKTESQESWYISLARSVVPRSLGSRGGPRT